MYLKNTASQKLEVFAFDYTTGAPKTGDAANITAYVNIDKAGYNALDDTSATEVDSTNKKGLYLFDLTQGETNGTKLGFFAKSSTSNISVVCRPAVSFTQPATGILAPATAGRTLVVDASGLADANTVKVGPTGSGTAQTAKDLGAINVTNLNTLSSHDPGATIGTSTLTQTQVTGGAYSVQSASCVLGDARIANLDATVSSRLATSGYTTPPTVAAIATGVWTDTTAGDFTTNASIGKSIMNGVSLGTGLTVAAVSGAVGSVTAGVTVTTNNDKTGYTLTVTPPTAAAIATSVLTTQMTESYAADGTAPTLAQAVFLIQQQGGEFAIAATTKTVKKLDGSTTAATFTLNDGTSPTAITRAT